MKLFFRFLPFIIVLELFLSFNAYGSQVSTLNSLYETSPCSSNLLDNKLFSSPTKNLPFVEIEEASEKKEEPFDFDFVPRFSSQNIPFKRLEKSISTCNEQVISYHFVVSTTPLFELFHCWKLPLSC